MYMVLMRANQKTAVHHLPGLLCHIFSCIYHTGIHTWNNYVIIFIDYFRRHSYCAEGAAVAVNIPTGNEAPS